ncbi:protein kinase [Streptomyces sp. NPDC090057]|uniref:serine/threonine-protein kinase n=1 Tax=Streptomyces sp. NPDC090057 TaxID=3365935 RepID=UPI00380732BC
MQGAVLDERFRIGELLGYGAVGEVWAAQDERLQREVAVKLVNGMFGAGEAERQARFRREVRLAARLSHPNIVTVHDWGDGTVGGRHVFYLVMERVQGQSLQRRLQTSPGTPWRTAAGWAVQIAQALVAAHAHGVIHRDIKPANVLLTPEGAAKVLDFGVAKFVGEAMSVHYLTATGTPLGSPPYMSPEQAEGVRELDHRSDLYSLGCLLYHAVTGRPPFVSESQIAVLRMQLDEVPVPPGALVEGLPGALNDLIVGLLAKSPADRPGDAAAVADALVTLLIDGPLPSGGDTPDLAGLGPAGSAAGRLIDKVWEMRLRAEADCAALRKVARQEAAREAELIRSRAESDAALIQAQAQYEAHRLREEAREEAERILAETREEAVQGNGAVRERRPGERVLPRFDEEPYGYEPAEVAQRLKAALAGLDRMWDRMAVLVQRIREITELLDEGRDLDVRWRRVSELAVRAAEQARQRSYHMPRGRGPEFAALFPAAAQYGHNRAQVNEYFDMLQGQQAAWRKVLTTLEKTVDDGERLLHGDGPPPK